VTVNSRIAELGGFPYFHFAVSVSNASSELATVTITRGGTTVVSVLVHSNSVKVLYLDWTDLRTAQATMVLKAGSYRLRSTRPVAVYQFNPLEYMVNSSGSYTNDASLLLPTSAWGARYAVASRSTWQWQGFNLPGFYAVVASQDNTKVALTPSATGGSVRAGGSVAVNGTGSVTLDTGDVLQVLSGQPISADLTGTIVQADKPVQVIAGHDCTFVPANIGYCSHLEESMIPTEGLARAYLVAPPALPGTTQPKAAFARIIGTNPGTIVDYDPPQTTWPHSLAAAGDHFEVESLEPFAVTASAPVLVAQYMKGQDAGGNSGNPAMVLASLTKDLQKEYLFHSPVGYEHSYVNVLAPSGATVELDGIKLGGWVPIGATGFGLARVRFAGASNGNHRAAGDAGFSITVYGYGQYASYWYLGGLEFGGP
jgi:hypothetical protein